MKLSYILTSILLSVVIYNSIPKYSTTSVVTVVGAVIASKSEDSIEKKYKRKDCPVCKGKGWYMSGDGIKKIDCQYCEPEQTKTKPYLLIK